MALAQGFLLLMVGASFIASEAHPTYWKERRGYCRAPAIGDSIMGKPVELATTQKELSLSGHTLSISTSFMEHLSVASSGVFSNPSVGGKIMCDGKMVAWNSPSTRRSVTWSAPTNAMVTLALAEGYGAVTLYTLNVPELVDSTTPVDNATVGIETTPLTTTSLPFDSTTVDVMTESATTTAVNASNGQMSSSTLAIVNHNVSVTEGPRTTSIGSTTVRNETTMMVTTNLPSFNTVVEATSDTVTKTATSTEIPLTSTSPTHPADNGVLSGAQWSSTAPFFSMFFGVSLLGLHGA